MKFVTKNIQAENQIYLDLTAIIRAAQLSFDGSKSTLFHCLAIFPRFQPQEVVGNFLGLSRDF